jgi:hypothetical protein
MSHRLSPSFVIQTALFTLCGLTIAGQAWGWGATGHRAIGLIADNALRPSTRAAIRGLLGPDTLAEVGTWADDMRPDPAFRPFETWHYINWKDGETLANMERNPAGDLEKALESARTTLCERTKPRAERADALRWLVHLVGDLHQPLHVGLGGPTRGGNNLVVLWFGEPANLHEVWDNGLLESTRLSFTEFVSFLDPPSEETLTAWRRGTFQEWLLESGALSQKIYADLAEERLGYPYAYRYLPLVRQQIQKGGARLASVIEGCLAPAP